MLWLVVWSLIVPANCSFSATHLLHYATMFHVIFVYRSQKHYPAPLAIPLPNYSSYDGKELERQASQRFGTIPRVTKIHDSARPESHENHEKR